MRSKPSAIVFASALLFGWPALAVDNVTQPLNRADCDKAGMHWDDSANVCASNQGGSTQAVAASTKSMAGGAKACYGARDDKAHEKEESLRQDVDSKGSLQQATTNQAGRSPSIPLAIS